MKKVFHALERAVGLVCRRIGDLGIAVLMGMMLLTVTDVTLRRVFNRPLSFSFEVTEGLLMVAVFCAIAYTTSTGRHISIDVLVERFPERARRKVETVVDFWSAILFLLVAWQSTLRGFHILDIGQVTGILEVPYYPFFFFVALGSTLAGLAILFRAINSLYGEAKP